MAGKLGDPMAGAASAERDAGKKDDAAPLTGKVRGRGGAPPANLARQGRTEMIA